jgi:hypothetical protein
MKTKRLPMGILGTLLVFSLIVTACPTESDNNTIVEDDVETFADVSGDFPLIAGQAGLTLVSAQKSNKTGIITITMGGTINKPSDFETLFSPGQPERPAGNYAYVSFSLASVIMPNAAKVIAIRQENDALRYYTGSASLLTELPTAPAFGNVEPNIYVPAQGTPLKWKANDVGAFTLSDAANCQFIVSSTASPKTVKIDITTWSANTTGATKTGDVATVILDYSALTINATGG